MLLFSVLWNETAFPGRSMCSEKYKEGENDVYECTSSISCPGYDKEVDFSFRVIIAPDDSIIIDEVYGIDEDDLRNAFEYVEDEV